MARQRTQPARGRRVEPKKSSPLPAFFVLLGVIAVGGVLILLSVLSNGAQQTTAPASITPDLTGLPAEGNAAASVKVVIYSDFQCPFCAQFATQIEPQLTRDYVDTGKIQYVYHDFPLQQHRNALPAANAARCAGEQGQFWPMHNLLFQRQSEWENDSNPAQRFGAYATELGLNGDQVAQCVATGKYTNELQQLGQRAIQAGVNETPTIVVDGKPVKLTSFATAYNDVKAAIDAALQAKGQR